MCQNIFDSVDRMLIGRRSSAYNGLTILGIEVTTGILNTCGKFTIFKNVLIMLVSVQVQNGISNFNNFRLSYPYTLVCIRLIVLVNSFEVTLENSIPLVSCILFFSIQISDLGIFLLLISDTYKNNNFMKTLRICRKYFILFPYTKPKDF